MISKDSTQLQRILSLIQDLSDARHTYTIDSLSQKYKISKRTAWRYIGLLEKQLGFDVLYEKEHRTGHPTVIRLGEGPLARPVFLNLNELQALYLTRDAFTALEGTHIKESIDSLYDKIENDLSVISDIDIVKDCVAMHIGPLRDYSRHKRVIRDISEAILCRRKLNVEYKSPWQKQREQYVLHPYLMVFYDNGLYIICFCEAVREIRTFLLERIKSYSVLKGEFFEKPRDFNKKKYFEHSFGIITDSRTEQVKVRFSNNVAEYIKEKKWHPSAQIKEHLDGSLVLSMRVCGKQEVLNWVLRFGEDARLLSPPLWAAEIKNKIAGMAKLYA